MPIYEFHCEKCEKDSEILVRSNDWNGTQCPHCGSTKLEKKFSVFASSGTFMEASYRGKQVDLSRSIGWGFATTMVVIVTGDLPAKC
jgi:putative FmdB family regulatory protein